MSKLIRHYSRSKNTLCYSLNQSFFPIRWQSTQTQLATEDVRKSIRPVKLKKKILKEPFMKSVFLSRFNNELLTYPEISPERLDNITDYVVQIESYFSNTVNPRKLDESGVISDAQLKQLRDLGLFGLKIPDEFGGKNLPETETSFVSEATSYDLSLSNFLMSNQELATNAITLFGNQHQKEKYLPKINNGECFPCFCFFEYIHDKIVVSTYAVPLSEGKGYEINGVKNWIANADRADLFIVFASTYKDGDKRTPTVTAFLMEKGPGITVGAAEDKLGMRAYSICDVMLDKAVVEEKQILGGLHNGFNIVNKVVHSGKLNIGPQCCAVMKRLTHDVTNFCINNKHQGQYLHEFEVIQGGIADIVLATYAVESMTYFYSGLNDNYEDPDITIESIIMKVASSEALNFVARKCMEIVGHQSYLKNHIYEKINRDAQFHLISDDKNSNLKLMLGYLGLEYAGQNLQDTIKKNRNPFHYPTLMLKKLLSSRDQVNDQPKLTLRLGDYLHPSLQESATLLEYCVVRFGYAVETTLTRNGALVADKHLEVIRLAEAAINIFALTSILGRASRSYCIGLKNANHEMEIAVAYANLTQKKIQKTLKEVIDGPNFNHDNVKLNIGKHTLNSKGYSLEHPLTRNFN